jgi:hypothetical protein
VTNPRIVVTVTGDGQVTAETVDILGDRCLDYIAVLEELIGGQVTSSAFTADYHRTTEQANFHRTTEQANFHRTHEQAQEQQVNRDVDPA